ncbi:MOSC domain-containing protein [Actinoplanes aureus]|uniref:MOSC domain-containing protein n=1 Tax=Actinoplanes aureus TaxID=2792083 RepID=A0A931C6E5_9ACTN|nr:MOSC N-terminal beta barrel domain-containing protein [Actinoplanes aureus]MBG0564264.1 MOSC domain-containing protein [Actinoplanes aureus]
MRVIQIRRYPVKSMLGEVVEAADVGERGLAGDRLWAVRDPDGKFGSGKNTRRFRRMPGLFGLRAYAGEPAVVELPDGRRFAADDPDGHRAVGDLLGRTVTLAPESGVPHHDEGPVSVITTAALRRLTELAGGEPDGSGVDPLRFRANLLIDVPGSGFPEDDWPGGELRIGPDLVLRPVRALTRCVMIDMAQERAGERNDLLKTLADRHALTFGVYATVERPGRVAFGDAVIPRPR